MAHPLAPWKMWGSTQLLTIDGAVASNREQLVKLNYKRPDSFQFFLHCAIVRGPNPIPFNGTVSVVFDLITGIGRSVVDTAQSQSSVDAFATFSWAMVAFGVIPRTPKWSTQTRTQPMIDGDATSRMLCDSFVGESINISARAETDIPLGWTVQATALIAPRTHIRPDWFADGLNKTRFTGGELGGT